MDKNSAELQQEQPRPTDLLSLPDDLLRICARSPALDEPSKHAALASCKPLSRAVLHTSLSRAVVDADRGAQAARSAKLLLQLWGEEEGTQREDKHVTLVLCSAHHARPEPCLVDLRGAGVCLPFITDLHLEVRTRDAQRFAPHTAACTKPHPPALHATAQGLALDALLPSSLGALLPNLRAATLTKCWLAPSARASLLAALQAALDGAPVMRLQELTIERLSVEAPGAHDHAAIATAQLRQLAKLPSLGNITLMHQSVPTLFLQDLATQLTRLSLHKAYRQVLPGTQTPAPAWQATLQQVAHCTGLRHLAIPCATTEELGLVAPALQRVRTLRLLTSESLRGDGDAVVELLLGLPHLTSLQWERSLLTLSRWYNDPEQQPCCWEELVFGGVTPNVLARLPLHSLKRPVDWTTLSVEHPAPVQEVEAAVANVMQRCPAGFRWWSPDNLPPRLGFLRGPDRDVGAYLQAVQPLLAPLASVLIRGIAWDAGLVKVLAQVLPRTCTHLALGAGATTRPALERGAGALPWVQRLTLAEMTVLPEDVVGCVHTVRRMKERGKAVQLREVVVRKPIRPLGWGEVYIRRTWGAAVREVARLDAGVVLRLEW